MERRIQNMLNPKGIKIISFSLCFAVLLFFATFISPAKAEDGLSSAPGGTDQSQPKPASNQMRIAKTYGLQDFTALWLPAAAFMPHDSSVTWNRVGTGSGAIEKTSAGFSSFWAPLNLPNGVDIFRVELHYFDNSTIDVAFICLTRYDVDNSYDNDEGCPTVPSGQPGDTTFGFDPLFDGSFNIVDNRHPHVIHVFNTADPGNFHFYGVRVVYALRISPAPAVATFLDVSVVNPFFQAIEAMADSGVTVGCSSVPPLFCPDNPVTREQMAAFLSRFGGLHFPDDLFVP
jgi:hypothetical protein